jgi:peptide/nickel transport system ATP-binding protein
MSETLVRETPVLIIENLRVSYRQGKQQLPAVQNFSLRIRPGETYGLVGESGSGKTTVALALMRYLPQDGSVQEGRIELQGIDLLGLSEAQMRRVWGKRISLVPQDPQSALNPSLEVGEQLAEALRHHLNMAAGDAWRRTLELFDLVQLADPERIARSYPHQISGGMQQRVLIAMALSLEPSLLVLDEPTTGLDVTTQAAILDLIRKLIEGKRTAAIYITHNLGMVANLCDRVAVMYAGELVEDAPTQDLFREPLHPYTKGLLDSIPRLGETKDKHRLRSILGQIPPLDERPSGCVFTPRCPLAIEICEQRPPLYTPETGRRTRCHRWEEISSGLVDAGQPVLTNGSSDRDGLQERSPVLNTVDVQVHFPLKQSLEDALRKTPRQKVQAVNGVSLEVSSGETLGLVGESGSGKTTLAKAIMGLVEKTGGMIELLAVPLPAELSQRDLETLRHLQMIFQNPEEALNPYLTVGETLRRPLITLLGKSHQEAEDKVQDLLSAVRLPVTYARRLPTQLSGGEKQRVAIARSFAANPDLLVCDEPVSSLDVSVQSSILELLNELQVEQGISLLFISHNLAVVNYLADQVAVMYLGHLMEVTPGEALVDPPYHPYTESLLSAFPLIDPQAEQKSLRLEGEIPSPREIPTGCPFHTRCPRFLGEICVKETPSWRFDERSGKRYFCHIPVEELIEAQERVFTFAHSRDVQGQRSPDG